MAKTIKLKSPDGKTITINAPDDATPEQINEVANNYISSYQTQQTPTAPEYTEGNTLAGDLKHNASLAGRNVIEGIAGIPAGVYNTISLPLDLLAGQELTKGQTPLNTEQYGTKLADALGLDKANEDEAFKSSVQKNLAGFLLPSALAAKFGKAGSLVQKAGEFMGGAKPLTTGAVMIGGMTAGEGMKQSLADDKELNDNQKMALEIGANILGSAGTSGVFGMAKGVGRTAPRLASAITGDVESVAGRLINRSAADEAAYIQSILESGNVPTIAKPIIGYAPRSSEIAGNAGISGLVRHAENDIMNSTALANRNFENQKTIKDFLQRKTAGTPETRQIYEDAIRADAAANSQAFKTRDLPVDLTTVRAELETAIAANKGNPSITAGLEKILADMPKNNTGFREAYNYKQYIDEMLRGNAFDDPVKRSIQQSAIALGNTKKALSKTLTAVEPEFAPFLQRQAEGIARLERQNLADELITRLSKNTSMVSNQNGMQETLNALSAPQLSALLKNKKVTSKLSDAQLDAFKRAQQHAELQNRASAGMARGSNTAQNFKTNELVMDDIIRGLVGDKGDTGILSGAIRGLGKAAGNIPLLRSLSPIGSRQAEISAIMAKAELDPKYMAELMKKYQLKDAPIDLTARGALGAGLRSSLGQSAQ